MAVWLVGRRGGVVERLEYYLLLVSLLCNGRCMRIVTGISLVIRRKQR